MKLIELTGADDSFVCVNVDHIAAFCQFSKTTTELMVGELRYEVKQTPIEIIQKIEDVVNEKVKVL